jgi:pimeloyl-ACP methyl ester carboxylesterase
VTEVRSADGTRITFDRIGDGPAVVLVLGALNDRAAAAPLAAALAPRFAVYSYDRRGRGASGDTSPYAVDREIEDLGALIDESGRGAFVFGHSSGAVLALEAAARGLPLAKLALYEPPFVVDESRAPLPRDYVPRLRELVSRGRRGDAVAYFMMTGAGLPAAIVDEIRSGPAWTDMEAMAHTLAYDGAIMGDTMSGGGLPSASWSSVHQPTLVIDGERSPAWQRRAAQALVEILPNARRLSLVGQDHGPEPAVLVAALHAFYVAGPVAEGEESTGGSRAEGGSGTHACGVQRRARR